MLCQVPEDIVAEVLVVPAAPVEAGVDLAAPEVPVVPEAARVAREEWAAALATDLPDPRWVADGVQDPAGIWVVGGTDLHLATVAAAACCR